MITSSHRQFIWVIIRTLILHREVPSSLPLYISKISLTFGLYAANNTKRVKSID